MSNAPRAYIVQPGDDYDRIARVVYGSTINAAAIRRGNPGVDEPLQPGAELIIPVIPGAPENLPQTVPANDEDETAIVIDGKRFRFWESVSITRGMDQIDTVTFTAPFEPDRPEFRDTFRPFSFRPVDVTVGGERLFTGTMIDVTPATDESSRTVSVSAYSVPGVLQDCTPPASAWPIEYSNLNLQQIAVAICGPFGIGVEFIGIPGAVFEQVEAKPGTEVLPFLAPLAQERNFVIGSTPEGNLRFWRSVKPGRPVARLREGVAPLLSVTPQFNPQQYFSHVTGMELIALGSEGSTFTVRNSKLRGSLRPSTFEVKDTQDADVKEAVLAKIGRMFGNACSYQITVPAWRDPNGRLWQPNTTLTLTAPGAMVYREYEFVIRTVDLSRDATSKTATLTLILPGSFEGVIPERLPWED